MRLRSPARLMLSLLMVAALSVPGVSLAANRASASKHRTPAKRKTVAANQRSAIHTVAAKSAKPTGRTARAGGKGTAATGSKASATAKGKSGKRTRRTSKRQKGQMVPTSDRISEIQQALAKDGSFNCEPTGRWDDGTLDAMRRFQEGHGLNPTGKLDAKTLQQLGLGSSTAGLAPPAPAASSLTAQKPAQTASRQ